LPAGRRLRNREIGTQRGPCPRDQQTARAQPFCGRI
jgi:hypothetical protein